MVYETYRSNAAEAPRMRLWLLGGLAASICLHLALYLFFREHQVPGMSMARDRLAPPQFFHMKQVSIPAMPEETKVKMPDTKPVDTTKLVIPSEKPTLEEVHVAPQITEASKNLFTEKPKVDPASTETMAKLTNASRNAIDKDLDNIAQSLIKEGPRMAHQPMIAVGSGKAGSGAGTGDSNVSIPGLASVDDMLANKGALHTGDKAAMPGGALFEYDKYDLLPEAVNALQKLAMLIERNPRATFSIEGHTDSFGPADYNQKLSELRAESVKDWLVKQMHIAPERIQTRGFGSTKLIVSADHSQDEQAPNRRVEIVVKTNRR
jgi:outer membrane protein OmpA-like peptidoglycan-associated protein